MSDLQDVIATNAIRAYNEGFARGIVSERERVIELLDEQVCTDDFCVHDACVTTLQIIELLQEESK
jgi:hypothetical protein